MHTQTLHAWACSPFCGAHSGRGGHNTYARGRRHLAACTGRRCCLPSRAAKHPYTHVCVELGELGLDPSLEAAWLRRLLVVLRCVRARMQDRPCQDAGMEAAGNNWQSQPVVRCGTALVLCCKCTRRVREQSCMPARDGKFSAPLCKAHAAMRPIRRLLWPVCASCLPAPHMPYMRDHDGRQEFDDRLPRCLVAFHAIHLHVNGPMPGAPAAVPMPVSEAQRLGARLPAATRPRAMNTLKLHGASSCRTPSCTAS